MKKILDMTPERAKKYFMKNTSYFGLELPKYFDFTDLLKKVDKKIQGKNLTEREYSYGFYRRNCFRIWRYFDF